MVSGKILGKRLQGGQGQVDDVEMLKILENSTYADVRDLEKALGFCVARNVVRSSPCLRGEHVKHRVRQMCTRANFISIFEN